MKSRQFNKGFDEVLKKTIRVLKKLDMNIEKVDRKRRTIIASTGVSLFSWGEDVQIRFQSNNSKTKVMVESSSKAQLIDWGSNGKNEKIIMGELAKTLK